ncbi:ScbR family autoregulator-binding transcription factor [Streptomyces flavofungini]|uniref:ScbR family autoregulator-binding transcription factor n=1 Tax=Streptomyces flavofungini TaxID=68200 RepID=UPI0025AF912F|nr:ScbR family autoregulator-binding transcription factor [Streptomyces flavofungini]WJV47456.1 ScbR family autoregulator-binding transcription factor [Streptomyces flavofungini]
MAGLAEPKQERAVRTREIVMRAAAEVFDEYGYGGASISKIMKRAGVTQGGMYFHFKSKLGLAEAVMASQQDFIELPPGEDGLQRLIDITAHITHELQHNVLFRASVRLAVEQEEFGRNDDTAYQEWAERFRVQLVAARARGELLDDVDEQEFSNVLVAAYTGTQIFSTMASKRADLPERTRTLWRYLLRAIATPSARETLRLPEAGTGADT